MNNAPPVVIGISIVVILLSIAIHEWAHAKFADLAGDPTPRMMGRVTLNPLAHLDPLGTIMIIFTSIAGWGIGWGKPVMVKPQHMRNPRWDHFTSVAAGPVSNLVIAVIFSLLIRVVYPGGIQISAIGTGQDVVLTAMGLAVLLNVMLFVFNLIPLGPLDGHWLVGAFLPEPARLKWYRFNQGPGAIILLVLILVPGLNVLSYVIQPAAIVILRFLIGGHLV
jgi:Zn-dependent protease